MPGHPRSILKKPRASMPHAMRKNEAGPSTLHRNTKLNAGSKLQKTVATSKRPVERRRRDREEDEDEEEEESDGFGGEDEEDVEMSEVDTDEEIARIKSGDGKEKKERKRKRPATTAETFGSTLTALLSEPAKKPKRSDPSGGAAGSAAQAATAGTEEPAKQAKQKQPAPSSTILSLSHARAPPSRSAENLERKAKRHLQALKEEKEDKARIRDVVEGWAARPVDGGAAVIGGQEFEKGLRKTAQRGVIKLFNAILVASRTAEEATTSLSARAGVKDEKPKGKKEKDNIMGRGGKAAPLTQESFLDLVRKG